MNIKKTSKLSTIVILLTICFSACSEDPKFIATDTGTDTKKDTDTGKDFTDTPDVAEDLAQTTCDPACGGKEVCKTDGFTCVACLDDTNCEGTQVCNTDLNTCVDCKDNNLCTNAAQSTCSDGTCGACVEDDDCTHITGLPRCDSGASCKVECEDDTHCEANEVCDLRPEETSYQTCAPKGDPLTQCESCVSDTQCDAGFHCIPLDFPVGTPHGNYCLKILGDGTCTNPYETDVNKVSLNGSAAESHCGISEELATCEAMLFATSGEFCGDAGDMGGGNADLGKCPANSGALCKEVLNKWKCSYSCNDDVQCSNSCEDKPNGFCR